MLADSDPDQIFAGSLSEFPALVDWKGKDLGVAFLAIHGEMLVAPTTPGPAIRGWAFAG